MVDGGAVHGGLDDVALPGAVARAQTGADLDQGDGAFVAQDKRENA